MTQSTTKFVTEREEFESSIQAGQNVMLTPALHLPSKVKNVSEHFRNIATAGETVSILNSLFAYRELSRLRKLQRERMLEGEEAIADVVTRLGVAVEGGTPIDLAWIQGANTAAGISAYANLHGAMSAASEVLDRKSAYVLACVSLYISIVSLVLGAWSLK
jgi:hypothetical protein